MDVEGDLFARGPPVLVAEAVGELAVLLGSECVVAGGDALLIEFV
jgi:hypothetical protein